MTVVIQSSRPEVFCKKTVLKNFTKFTGKYLCQSLFFNKVFSLWILRIFQEHLFFTEHLRWLLLYFIQAWKFEFWLRFLLTDLTHSMQPFALTFCYFVATFYLPLPDFPFLYLSRWVFWCHFVKVIWIHLRKNIRSLVAHRDVVSNKILQLNYKISLKQGWRTLKLQLPSFM